MATLSFDNEANQGLEGTPKSESIILNNCRNFFVIGAGGSDSATVNGGGGHKLGFVDDIVLDQTSNLGYVLEYINKYITDLTPNSDYLYYRPFGKGANKLSITNSSDNAALFGNGNSTYNMNSGSNNWVRAGNGSNKFNIAGGNKNVAVSGYGANKFNITGGTYNMVAVDTMAASSKGKNNTVTISGGENHVVYLEDGNDTVNIKSGAGDNMFVLAGIGNDKINVASGNGHTIMASYAEYADGTVDEYSYNATMAGNNSITLKGSNKNTVMLGVGKDTITLTNTNENDIKDLGGNNKLTLNNASVNNIVLGAGNDVITVKSGSDNSFVLGKGTDKITLDFNKIGGQTVIDASGYNSGDVDSIVINGVKFEELEVDGTVDNMELSQNGKKIILQGLRADDGKSTVKFKDGTKTFAQLVGLMEGEIVGTDKADKITVNKAEMVVKAGAGNDKITVISAGNNIYGEAGKDTITVQNDNNKIEAGDDIDTITVSNSQNVTIDGGKGADKITVDMSSSNGITIKASEGDVITLKNAALSDVTVNKNEDVLEIATNNGNNSVVIENWSEQAVASIKFNSSTIKSGVFDAIVNGFIAEGVVAGTDESDSIIVSGGQKISGAKGKYTLAQAGTKKYYFDSEDISIEAGNGNDTITINNLHEADVWAGNGDDTININGGYNNYIECGEGNDTVTIDWKKAGKPAARDFVLAINESESTATGNDKLVIKNAKSSDFKFRFEQYYLDKEDDNIAKFDSNGTQTALVMTDKSKKEIVVYNWDNNALASIKFTDKELKTDDIKRAAGDTSVAPDAGGNSNTTPGHSDIHELTDKDNNKTIVGDDHSEQYTLNGVQNLNLNTKAGNDTVTFKKAFEVNLDTGAGEDTIILADGGTSEDIGNLMVNGGAGNDKITVNAGFSMNLDGGEGNDEITINKVSFIGGGITAMGSAGNDTITVKDIDSVSVFGGYDYEDWPDEVVPAAGGSNKISITNVKNVRVNGADNITEEELKAYDKNKKSLLAEAVARVEAYWKGTLKGDTITVVGFDSVDAAGGVGNDVITLSGKDKNSSRISLGDADDGNDIIEISNASRADIAGGNGDDKYVINWNTVGEVTIRQWNDPWDMNNKWSDKQLPVKQEKDTLELNGVKSTDVNVSWESGRYFKYNGQSVDGVLRIADKKTNNHYVEVAYWNENKLTSVKFDDKTLTSSQLEQLSVALLSLPEGGLASSSFINEDNETNNMPIIASSK